MAVVAKHLRRDRPGPDLATNCRLGRHGRLSRRFLPSRHIAAKSGGAVQPAPPGLAAKAWPQVPFHLDSVRNRCCRSLDRTQFGSESEPCWTSRGILCFCFPAPGLGRRPVTSLAYGRPLPGQGFHWPTAPGAQINIYFSLAVETSTTELRRLGVLLVGF
jgi:hypothetical protein